MLSLILATAAALMELVAAELEGVEVAAAELAAELAAAELAARLVVMGQLVVQLSMPEPQLVLVAVEPVVAVVRVPLQVLAQEDPLAQSLKQLQQHLVALPLPRWMMSGLLQAMA